MIKLKREAAENEAASGCFWDVLPDALDPVSLTYRRFAAVWHEEDGQRYVTGYAFGDSEVASLIRAGGSPPRHQCADPQAIREIYRSIRAKQQEQDWSARARLPLLTAFKEPWKNMENGWYALRSRQAFPMHLSIVHKTAYFLWLEHAAVCENEAELAECLARAKTAHHLRELLPAATCIT